MDARTFQALFEDDPITMDSAPMAPPIVQSSLFTFPSFDALKDRFAGRTSADTYSRASNPTVRALEGKLAALEGGEAAIALGSGMGAISSVVLSLVKAGDRIVSTTNVYSDAYRLFEMLMPRMGVTVDYVDCGDTDALAAALPGARLCYLESPSSFVFETFDVPAIAAMARRHGVVTVFDNSFATPLGQQPLSHGIDIVVHSISKYLGGHSDIVAGCAVGARELIEEVRGLTLPLLGAKLSAMEAWLVIRGLRTLPVRLREHGRAADHIVAALARDPRVARIHRPEVGGSLHGLGGLFTVEFAPGIDIRAFCDALKVLRLGVSWGGFESLALPAAVAARQDAGPNALSRFGVSKQAVRIFAGLEGPEVILADIEQAMAVAQG